ncbi:hypothetical protein [Microbulbifer guangxiensis]|uniref:hypothetical protein n=1 Tax=Microbulbifer guangxiensis TaxID=2904249 RepID=UPI001F2695F8|nr:hypothetical protein [Microbulbifer guangxiensis]
MLTSSVRAGCLITVCFFAVGTQADTFPRPEDVATIDGIMKAYYEVISGPAGGMDDYERDKSLHHPNARITILSSDKDGRTKLEIKVLEDFHTPREPRSKDFWEWETERHVDRHKNIAHIWSHYKAGPVKGGRADSEGVNSVKLFWDGKRWWIMSWMTDYSAQFTTTAK